MVQMNEHVNLLLGGVGRCLCVSNDFECPAQAERVMNDFIDLSEGPLANLSLHRVVFIEATLLALDESLMQ